MLGGDVHEKEHVSSCDGDLCIMVGSSGITDFYFNFQIKVAHSAMTVAEWASF